MPSITRIAGATAAIVAAFWLLSFWPAVKLHRMQQQMQGAPEPAPAVRKVEPPADFVAGQQWAKQNRPQKPSLCQGTLEFIEGCRNYFHTYLEQPKPKGQGHFEGMTTAECQVEVNANFEALRERYLRDGNPRGAEVNRRKQWLPALEQCENYDRYVENTFLPKAYAQLQQLVDRLKAGGTVTAAEQAGVVNDFNTISKFKNEPYKKAYFELNDEFLQRAGGTYKEPVTVHARISCEEYQAKIDEMRKLAGARVAEMQALKRSDGVVAARHSELNQQRIDMMWDWKYFTDGAKARGCEISTK